ncbi:hypothetical protein E2R68_13535 [Psychromonas sp. RZ22]|uniref:LPS translocon maturation chaperone LptM n=1 Tax=Psychromonas algarum TaxID=2555643 RepID=UPI00106844DC|nr:lipoprotein [Psychromonas sp. RZ22]TEW53173.1 hypothetical protein E2R68_13535 [Psychromonas sp. RZ22]
MKKLNLSLIALLFSSLLTGCGMSGPLYREAPPAVEKEPVQTQQSVEKKEDQKITEENESEASETVINEDSNNN